MIVITVEVYLLVKMEDNLMDIMIVKLITRNWVLPMDVQYRVAGSDVGED